MEQTTASRSPDIWKPLDATEKGLGVVKTPIFPNLHLQKSRERCQLQPREKIKLWPLQTLYGSFFSRLFPNFTFIDTPFNIKYYKKGDYNENCNHGLPAPPLLIRLPEESDSIVTGREMYCSFTTINLVRLGIQARYRSQGAKMDQFSRTSTVSWILCKRPTSRTLRIKLTNTSATSHSTMGEGNYLVAKTQTKWLFIDVIKHSSLSIGFIEPCWNSRCYDRQTHGWIWGS